MSLSSIGPSVALNSDATVTCSYRGVPEPDVHWYHNGTELQSNVKHRIEITVGQSILTVRNVNESDAGVYRCSVSNVNTANFGGTDFANITLDVYSKLY